MWLADELPRKLNSSRHAKNNGHAFSEKRLVSVCTAYLIYFFLFDSTYVVNQGKKSLIKQSKLMWRGI